MARASVETLEARATLFKRKNMQRFEGMGCLMWEWARTPGTDGYYGDFVAKDGVLRYKGTPVAKFVCGPDDKRAYLLANYGCKPDMVAAREYAALYFDPYHPVFRLDRWKFPECAPREDGSCWNEGVRYVGDRLKDINRIIKDNVSSADNDWMLDVRRVWSDIASWVSFWWLDRSLSWKLPRHGWAPQKSEKKPKIQDLLRSASKTPLTRSEQYEIQSLLGCADVDALVLSELFTRMFDASGGVRDDNPDAWESAFCESWVKDHGGWRGAAKKRRRYASDFEELDMYHQGKTDVWNPSAAFVKECCWDTAIRRDGAVFTTSKGTSISPDDMKKLFFTFVKSLVGEKMKITNTCGEVMDGAIVARRALRFGENTVGCSEILRVADMEGWRVKKQKK